jgi:RimJ/RimL family protein N-acetyltransferase
MTTRDFETARLSFRIPARTDFEDSAAMWGDPAVARYIAARPFTREECWARLLRYVGHWQLLGYGFWTVRERASGAFVGEVGFGEFRREIEPRIDDAPEIGWILSPAAHGKGYATEAARACLDWIEGKHGHARTLCIIQPENAASLRVAAKCGYNEFARTKYRDTAAVLLERLVKESPVRS